MERIDSRLAANSESGLTAIARRRDNSRTRVAMDVVRGYFCDELLVFALYFRILTHMGDVYSRPPDTEYGFATPL